jgi:hypothetical protein
MIKTFTREEKKIEVVNSKKYPEPAVLAPSFNSICLIRSVAYTYTASSRKINDAPAECGVVLS